MDEQKWKQFESALVALRTEHAVLERMLYQFKNAFSKQKVYQSLKQTCKRLEAAVQRIQWIGDLSKADEGDLRLLKKLFGAVTIYATIGAHHSKKRVELGHLWSQWTLTLAVASRIWCLCEFILKLITPAEPSDVASPSVSCVPEPVVLKDSAASLPAPLTISKPSRKRKKSKAAKKADSVAKMNSATPPSGSSGDNLPANILRDTLLSSTVTSARPPPPSVGNNDDRMVGKKRKKKKPPQGSQPQPGNTGNDISKSVKDGTLQMGRESSDLLSKKLMNSSKAPTSVPVNLGREKYEKKRQRKREKMQNLKTKPKKVQVHASAGSWTVV